MAAGTVIAGAREASSQASGAHRLSPAERALLDRDGFVLRRAVFGPSEYGALREACEALVARLVAAKRNAKITVGSYLFERQRDLGCIVKWELHAPDVVQGASSIALCPTRAIRIGRALLYSYQPAGYPHMREINAFLTGKGD